MITGRKFIPLVFLAGGIFLLVKLHTVLLPFVLAAAIAYTLNPLVAYFEMRGIRRQKAVILVYIGLACFFVMIAYVSIATAIQGAANISSDLPVYTQKIRQFFQTHAVILQQIPGMNHVSVDGHGWMISLLQKAPSLFQMHILPLLELTLLVPFLVFFFMLDGPAFLDGLVDRVPARYAEMTLNIVLEINYSFGNYLRGLLIQAFFMGLTAGICYSLMGLHYSVYVAAWVALTSVIPYLGPISAAMTGGLIALIQWGTWTALLKVLVVFGVIRFVDDWFLQPFILRKAVHIHPILLVFTLMAGASLGGFWGILFALPVACMVKVLLEVGWQWYQSEYGSHTAPHETAQIPVI